MKSQRVRIQKFLIALARDSQDFHAVSYQTSAGSPALEPDEVDFGQFEPPCTVLCNEISSSFDVDLRYGKRLIGERSVWNFELKVRFNKEVIVEKFEDNLAQDPPYLGRDETEGLKGVRLNLERTQIIHPVKHEGHAGTQVKFFFRAEQSRN